MNQNRIRIYSLTTTYPGSFSSKKPRFVHDLNKELVKLGDEVIVISPHSKNLKTNFQMDSVFVRFFKYLPEKYEIGDNSIPDVIKTKRGVLKVIFMNVCFFLYTFFLCVRDNDYILHGHWAFPGGYIAYIISKLLKKKYIVTVHGSEIPSLEKFSFLKTRVVSSLNNSSKVITGTNYLKKKLISMGVKEEKIQLIRPVPNFVNTSFDENLLSIIRKRFTDSENKIILTVGRLTEVKGTEFLLRSLPLLKTKNIHLIIVGEGILLKNLKKLSKSIEVEKKVTFFGSANKEELSQLYKISDVFVFPSIVTNDGGSEGTGLVIPEAMDAGLPVIASNVGGIIDIIENDINGIFVNEKDPKSIAEAVDRLLSDKLLVEKLVKNSKKTVKEFLPRTIAEEYYKIFHTINEEDFSHRKREK